MVGVGHHLGGCLRGAVRIVSSEVVGLDVAGRPLLVPVHLVAGHHHHASDVGLVSDRLEEVDGAHHVGLEGLHRVAVRSKDQGLGGEMEHQIGPYLVDDRGDRIGRTDVGQPVVDQFGEPDELEHGGRREDLPGHAGDPGAHFVQPEGEPRTLEARVAGHQHPSAREGLAERLSGHRRSGKGVGTGFRIVDNGTGGRVAGRVVSRRWRRSGRRGWRSCRRASRRCTGR